MIWQTNRSGLGRAGIVGLAFTSAVLVLASTLAHADRMALWNIVHEQCVPHAAAGQAPKPCDGIDPSGSIAFLKDRNGVAQMLAIPTRKVTGMEDPAILSPEADGYFAQGWAARANLEAHLGKPVPRDGVAITINSMVSRSQDQLHLHVDCVDPAVASALKDYQASLDATWRPMTVALNGRKYWARRVDSPDLAGVSPFRLLADDMTGAKTEMGLWTLGVVGATFDGKPGFIALADHAELTAGGHAEDIQDHACAIAGPKS